MTRVVGQAETIWPDFTTQMMFFGWAVIGPIPRDPMTAWLENERCGDIALFDQTESYFETTLVNGERPPWWHALLPAIAKRGAEL